MTVAFTLALTVGDGSSELDDVLVRGNAEQTVGELARRLAVYLGRPAVDSAGQSVAYGLRVERTGEQLRPKAPLSHVDLLEGDTVTVLVPRGAPAARRRPRWADEPAPGEHAFGMPDARPPDVWPKNHTTAP